MEFVDTHCHVNHEQFDEDRTVVLARARSAGVTRMVCIGYDWASSLRALELAQEDGVYAAIGVHPEAAREWTPVTAAKMRRLWDASGGRIIAYGEMGLDYHWDSVPRDRQQAVFAEQIDFASILSPTLPLIIHCRDAQDDVLAVLRASGADAPVVMHCFTGDEAMARACLEAGCYLGIGGVVTFKKSDALRKAVATAPLGRLLLETDSPYLAPQPWRGRRNEPSYLPAVAEAVAAAKGLSIDTVVAATTANALALFGML